MNGTSKILSLENITKAFSGTRALHNVTFDLFEGEIHCLVGENGAGKSTLIKILSGAEKPDRGKIVVFGKEYAGLSPRESIVLGISTIYQDVDLVDTLTVADNIFLGSEITTKYGSVDSWAQERVAKEMMGRLNIDIDPGLLVEELTPAQKQVLQIFKALSRKARIMIMDEPTSSLGRGETHALMNLINNLATSGMGIIYISHHLDEVFKVGHRITVLKDGEVVSTYDRRVCTMDRIVKDMVGREASLFYKRERVPIGPISFVVSGYSRSNIVKNVSFDVREGEIFGIGGLVGSGRTELANLLLGIDKREGGRLFLRGKDITPSSPRAAIKRGLCMVAENRKDNLFPGRSVRENVGVFHVEQSNLVLNLKKELRLVSDMAAALRIRLDSIEQEVSSLSGGNQQKSVLARWLLSNSSVFIFDEPTKGVDIGAKEEIYKLMTDLVRRGKSIIMISSVIPELLSMSDRIGIMRNGQMVKVVAAGETTEEDLLKEFLGLAE